MTCVHSGGNFGGGGGLIDNRATRLWGVGGLRPSAELQVTKAFTFAREAWLEVKGRASAVETHVQ